METEQKNSITFITPNTLVTSVTPDTLVTSVTPDTLVTSVTPDTLVTSITSITSVTPDTPYHTTSKEVFDVPEKVPPNIKSKSGDFDTLVLSGGSIHAIIMLGALQYAEDNYLLNKIHRYIGTSAGALCSYLLAIGYTPIEIMVFLCTKQMLEKMKNFNIVAMMNGSGATSFSHIHEQLEKMTIEKLGKLITLGDLYSVYNKELICVTHNLTSDKIEILSHETYPDMPCLIALRMSSNLPFIFDHFKYLGSFYTDGGVSNNFPVDIADKRGDKVLGMVIHNISKNFSENNHNMIEYMYKLMSIPINQNVLNNISSISEKCTVIKLQPDNTPFFNFNLDTHTKLEMFSNGFIQMKKYWEN